MTDARPCCGDGPALSRRGFLGAAAAGALPASIAASAAQRNADLFLLGLEEHFATPELMRLNGIRFAKVTPRFDINDVSAGRIAEMDAAGIGFQVLAALTPGAQNLPGADGVAYARTLNVWVANEVTGARPERFRAFATLPLSESGADDDELEYAVRELGFVGCMTYAVLGALGEKNDPGLHSGILDDGVMELVDLEDVRFRPVNYTHGAGTVARIDRFVSINSALEINLAGQMNAEMNRGTQATGTGRSIVALGATAAGARSRASCRDSARATRRPRSGPN